MRGPRPFACFSWSSWRLRPLVQSFWFGRAWRAIDAVVARTAHPVAGALDRGRARRGWAALDMLRVRVLPRRAFGPWGRAVVQLWLIASCLSRHDGDGEPRVVLAARHGGPAGGRGRVGPARHTVFRYVVWLGAVCPSWQRCMVPQWDGSGIASSPLRCRSRIYLHIWMGCALSTSVISTSGPSCPARRSGAPST